MEEAGDRAHLGKFADFDAALDHAEDLKALVGSIEEQLHAARRAAKPKEFCGACGAELPEFPEWSVEAKDGTEVSLCDDCGGADADTAAIAAKVNERRGL
jgi:hypothetical protein